MSSGIIVVGNFGPNQSVFQTLSTNTFQAETSSQGSNQVQAGGQKSKSQIQSLGNAGQEGTVASAGALSALTAVTSANPLTPTSSVNITNNGQLQSSGSGNLQAQSKNANVSGQLAGAAATNVGNLTATAPPNPNPIAFSSAVASTSPLVASQVAASKGPSSINGQLSLSNVYGRTTSLNIAPSVTPVLGNFRNLITSVFGNTQSSAFQSAIQTRAAGQRQTNGNYALATQGQFSNSGLITLGIA
jgi:hypothetical protein